MSKLYHGVDRFDITTRSWELVGHFEGRAQAESAALAIIHEQPQARIAVYFDRDYSAAMSYPR